jgi:hypothetical protein
LDVDFSEDLAASDAYKNDQRNIRKVKEATEQLELNIIYPLREGKKLLVLDIDYSEPNANFFLFHFLLNFSHIGYQTAHVGKPSTCRMCEAEIA